MPRQMPVAHVLAILCALAVPAAHAQDHDHSAHTAPPAVSGQAPPQEPLPPFIPPLTDADREAAFPDLDGHAVHDTAINYYVLFDQFEWQSGSGAGAFSWDTKGWIGQDRHRFWFRTEGDRAGGRTEQAQTHLLYGRAIARWWDLTAGLRVDTLPSTPRTALAIGVQGLAPYWFEVEASAYIEPSGRTHVRIETEYELLITNRLVLQPLVEFEVYGSADAERHIGAGLSTADVGLRLRYEFKRELAPYLGVVWNRKFFSTADRARAADHSVSDTRLAVGLRWWL